MRGVRSSRPLPEEIDGGVPGLGLQTQRRRNLGRLLALRGISNPRSVPTAPGESRAASRGRPLCSGGRVKVAPQLKETLGADSEEGQRPTPPRAGGH